MSPYRRLYRLALVSHLALLALIASWYLWLAPNTDYSLGFVFGLWVLPLLLPLPGLLRARPYTFAWSGFILMLYLAHSLTVLWIGDSPVLATAELLLTLTALGSGLSYARLEGRRQGLGLKKKGR